MSLVCEEDYLYLNEDSSFKKFRHKGERDKDLVVTSENIKIKGKFLHVVQRLCKETYTRDRNFVVAYNRKLKNNASTDGIYAPSNFRSLFKTNLKPP